MTHCDLHEWPDGHLTTAEGLPRCPLCRVDIPGGIGPRPKRRRGRRITEPAPTGTTPTPPIQTTPVLDHQQLAAGDHPTLEDL